LQLQTSGGWPWLWLCRAAGGLGRNRRRAGDRSLVDKSQVIPGPALVRLWRRASRVCSQPCQPLRERTSTGHGYCVQTPDARGHACLRSAVLAIGALSIGHDGEASPRRRLLRPPPRAHNVPGHMRSLPPPATQFPPSIQLQLQSCAAPARPACCRELARPLAN